MTSRLGRAPFLAILTLVSGAAAALPVYVPVEGAGLAVIAAGEVALLAALFAACRPRLFDLGQSPDDAMLILVPLANIALVMQCLGRTPSEGLRTKRLATWQGEIGPFQAFSAGLSLWVRALPLILPLALVGGGLYSVGNAGCAWFLDWMNTAPPATVDATMQALFGASGFLTLYFFFQLAKRHAVSRASWIPTFFALPFLMLAIALLIRGDRGLGQAIVSLPDTAVMLLWNSTIAGVFALLWLSFGDRLARGESLGEAWNGGMRALYERGGDLVAVHGGAAHAVFIGIQVVIPGIHYLLMYSFTDMVALFEPDRPAYARSAELSTGVRRRLFITQMLGFLLYFFPWLLIAFVGSGYDAGALLMGMMTPTPVAWQEAAIEGFLWIVVVALIKLSVLQLYRARVEAVGRRPIEVVVASPDAANPFAAPTTEPVG